MLFNFVLHLGLLTFLDSSVADESFVDETRVRVSMISLFVLGYSKFKKTIVSIYYFDFDI